MKKFVLLAHGEMARTPQLQQAQREWWSAMQGHVVDSGNPLVDGHDVTKDGQVVELGPEAPAALGYSIVEAESRDAVVALLKACPMDMWVYEALPM